MSQLAEPAFQSPSRMVMLTGPLGSVTPKYSSYSSSGSMVSPGSKLSTTWLSASSNSMMARLRPNPGQLRSSDGFNGTFLARKDSLLSNTIPRSAGEDDQMPIHGMQGVRVVNQPAFRFEQLGLGVDGWVGAVVPLGAENTSLRRISKSVPGAFERMGFFSRQEKATHPLGYVDTTAHYASSRHDSRIFSPDGTAVAQ